MKKYLITILSSFLVVGVVSAFTPATLFIETWEGIKKQAVYSQEQADKLFKDGYKLHQGEMLGTSITTIQGTDTLKDSRTTINDNFTALNSGKIEVGTTSVASITTLPNLSSIGTITTGVWNGTAIPVGYGGTGTTSPSRYQVILGDGSSGLTVASSTGVSGQYFVSNGANAYPSWQTASVDQAANYTWTGTHTFTASTTFSATTTGVKIIEPYLASTTITKMDAVYMATSTGGILQANASYTASSTYYQFLGFALNGATNGQVVYVQTMGVVSGFTGLTKGREYFVGNTAGTISATMGNVPIMVGRAVSTTQLLIDRQKRWGLTETYTTNAATSTKYTDGEINYTATTDGSCDINRGTDSFTHSSGGAGLDAAGSAMIKQNETVSVYCASVSNLNVYWRAYN